MVSDPRGGRALALIEASLTESDPALAALFERFARQAGAAPNVQPHRRRRRRAGWLLLAVSAVLLAGLAVLASLSHAAVPSRSGWCVAMASACASARSGCQRSPSQAASRSCPPAHVSSAGTAGHH